MAQVKIGDRVRIADREPTSADVKSGLYYNYFRNLTGVIERVYDDDNVCVNVDIDSLPEDVLLRHREIETAARDKWINGLSQEQRSRLTEQDRQFKMGYKALVAMADVLPHKGGPGKSTRTKQSDKPAAKQSSTVITASDDEKPKAKPAAVERRKSEKSDGGAVAKGVAKSVKAETAAKTPSPKTSTASKATKAETETKRLTQKDLEAKEREFLKSLKAKQSTTSN
ncbi:MAG: hypothetical protein Q7N50_04515 [Armatimonadota bacterium]|nr:hypothetical protein [Armatimonadota bacterium]